MQRGLGLSKWGRCAWLEAMKSLVWLLLAVFCAALAPVQLVNAAQPQARGCCHHGCCGMPCCPPPAPAPTVLNAPEPAIEASRPAARQAEPVSGALAKFYAAFVEPAVVRPALPASAQAARAADVPLFKAHCSFLI